MMVSNKEDVFSLEEGVVVLQWPSRLSKDNAQDLVDWLNLIIRKIKRAADAPEGDSRIDEDERKTK